MGNAAEKPGEYEEPVLPEGVYQVRISVYKLDITGVGFLDAIGAGITGAYHSGLVVAGEEWSYGGHEEEGTSGVYACQPEMNDNYTFYKRVIVGELRAPKKDFERKIHELASTADWDGTAYDLMEHNCNHWTSALCYLLMKRRPPDWINNTADSFARARRRKQAEDEALDAAFTSYASRHPPQRKSQAAGQDPPEAPGGQAFKHAFRTTFDKGWESAWAAGQAEIKACPENSDPEECKRRIENEALTAAGAAAGAAAEAVATAARAAQVARAAAVSSHSAAELRAWDATWQRESGSLLRTWQQAALAGSLSAAGAPDRAKAVEAALEAAESAAALAAVAAAEEAELRGRT